MGRTASGKSSIAKEVCKRMGLKLVKSYTTRPMRPGEEKDSDHIFITEEEVDQYRNQIAAYTEIDGYKYFTTYDVIDQSDVYVIDPKGVDSLKYKCRNKYRFVEIYIWIPKVIAEARAVTRGDDMEKFASRYKSESEQFSDYEKWRYANYSLLNMKSFEESVDQVCQWIQDELNKPVIYVDFDGVIVDTIGAICALYNSDFAHYKKFKPVHPNQIQTYEFSECTCASKETIDWYFNTPRFFKKLRKMMGAYLALSSLSNDYQIVVVSHGYSPNLQAKEQWIKKHLSFVDFCGVNLKEYQDKSCVDMSGGIFIDDKLSNLDTSNAKEKIVFGKEYPWNTGNTKYTRVMNWMDALKYIRSLEGTDAKEIGKESM